MKRAVHDLLRSMTPDEWKRFWSKVCVGKPGECWRWRTRTGGDYPSFRLWRGGKRVHVNAHVVALFSRLRRAFPQSNHECDDTWCCNPHHLHAGTASSNLRECWARGRRAA